MKLLDQWEAEAKKNLPEPVDFETGIEGPAKIELITNTHMLERRILALIDLVRKKDKALNHGVAAMTYAYEDRVDQYYLNVQDYIKEAIALTDLLK